MDIQIIDNSYIISINQMLKLYANSTHVGCFQNAFYNNQQVECFKSYILTQALCINFCYLRGMRIKILLACDSLHIIAYKFSCKVNNSKYYI